jgi:hypothetical protein
MWFTLGILVSFTKTDHHDMGSFKINGGQIKVLLDVQNIVN